MFTSRRDAFANTEENEINFSHDCPPKALSMAELKSRGLLPAILICRDVDAEIPRIRFLPWNWNKVLFLTGVEWADDWCHEAASYGVFRSLVVGESCGVKDRQKLLRLSASSGMAVCFLGEGASS
jgi:hypothetical protein